jgi:hypothetical protein
MSRAAQATVRGVVKARQTPASSRVLYARRPPESKVWDVSQDVFRRNRAGGPGGRERAVRSLLGWLAEGVRVTRSHPDRDLG